MEDGRGSSGIGSGKSIGLAEGILLPAETVESNRSRPKLLEAGVHTSLSIPVKLPLLTIYLRILLPVNCNTKWSHKDEH